ncbi:hypothetical protein Y032_0223g2670 [Ancylostoma ceylanicum]|uniref:Uncharacterized protein n=1 Tax=Ancylostoma ceylanicum TaxID=53326 RepID=A0A016SIK3_9BILA|nr:hypothetical protein Y032_0223g2670 [Ancylostoma ceylanicum]
MNDASGAEPNRKPFGCQGFPPGPPPQNAKCTAMERVAEWFRRNDEWNSKNAKKDASSNTAAQSSPQMSST